MVKYPGMRRGWILSVQAIADKEGQKTKWIVKNNSYGFWFTLRNKLEILDILDDEDFQNSIGVIFRDKEEAIMARNFASILDKTLDKIGIEQPDEVYLNSPLWDDVVEAAKQAYEVLMKDEDLDALLEAERNRVVE